MLNRWEELELDEKSRVLYNEMKFDFAHRTQEKVGKNMSVPFCSAGKEN